MRIQKITGNKFIFLGALVLLCSGLFLAAFISGAQAQVVGGLNEAKTASGLPGLAGGDLSQAIGKIIGGVMGLVGSIMFVYMLYGGFRWMTAGGDNKAISEAQAIIKNAVIGIAIIIFAYALANFVITGLSSVVSTTPESNTGGTGAEECGSGKYVGYSCILNGNGRTCVPSIAPCDLTNMTCCK